MPDSNTKQLAFVARLGPAFNLDEIKNSHAVLDWCGVPRRLKGVQLTLPDRIMLLNNQLEAARSQAHRKQIFILTKIETESLIPEEYRTTEVES